MEQKKRDRKVLKRKVKSKEKIALRRKAIKKKHKEDRDEAYLQRQFRLKSAPFRNTPEIMRQEQEDAESVAARHQPVANKALFHQRQVTDQQAANDKMIIERLKHNQKILEALEEAIKLEDDERKAVQEQLESEGHHTLREKMDALTAKAEETLDIDNSELHEALAEKAEK